MQHDSTRPKNKRKLSTISLLVIAIVVLAGIVLFISSLVLSHQKAQRDITRRADLKSLSATLEAVYDQFGYYPTLKQLNDPDFQKANYTNFNDSVLRDPASTSAKLVDQPRQHAYAYQVQPNGCTNFGHDVCKQFILTAIAEDGKQITVSSE
jgi:hypothetical protein